MAYDGWELGFESSRSGAGRKAWNREVNLNEQKENGDAWNEWERGFESSRHFSPVTEHTADVKQSSASANKKLSHCLLGKQQQVVLLDSDMIVWDK